MSCLPVLYLLPNVFHALAVVERCLSGRRPLHQHIRELPESDLRPLMGLRALCCGDGGRSGQHHLTPRPSRARSELHPRHVADAERDAQTAILPPKLQQNIVEQRRLRRDLGLYGHEDTAPPILHIEEIYFLGAALRPGVHDKSLDVPEQRVEEVADGLAVSQPLFFSALLWGEVLVAVLQAHFDAQLLGALHDGAELLVDALAGEQLVQIDGVFEEDDLEELGGVEGAVDGRGRHCCVGGYCDC